MCQASTCDLWLSDACLHERSHGAKLLCRQQNSQILSQSHVNHSKYEEPLLLLIPCYRKPWQSHNLCNVGNNRDLEDAQRDDFHVCKCGGDKVFCPAKECLSLACMECDDGLNEGFSPCFCCDQSHCDRHSGKECVVCEEPFCDECMSTCSSCQQPVCPKHLSESANGRQCWHPNSDSADSADSDDPSRKRRKTLFA